MPPLSAAPYLASKALLPTEKIHDFWAYFQKILYLCAMEKKNIVVAIGRQFGCGAREIGQIVARELGFGYYDKELLTEAAKQSGISAEFLESTDERAPQVLTQLWSTITGYNAGSYFMGEGQEQIFAAQAQVMRHIAERHSCVIVGRCADFLLRNHARVVSVFLHATLDDRVARIIERGDAPDEKSARALALKENKLRAAYYNFYTDQRWGDAATYDLCVNASRLGTEATAAMLVSYIRQVYGEM